MLALSTVCMDILLTIAKTCSEYRMALVNLGYHSLESEITLIEEVHPPPPSLDTMSIYMMSSSIDPLVSTITDGPSDLSLLLFPQPPPQPQP